MVESKWVSISLTQKICHQRGESHSVSRLTDILCQYFTAALLIWVVPQPHSHKINEQLVFAKMNLPDHTVPLVPWICLNFEASAIVTLLDRSLFTIHGPAVMLTLTPERPPVTLAYENMCKQSDRVEIFCVPFTHSVNTTTCQTERKDQMLDYPECIKLWVWFTETCPGVQLRPELNVNTTVSALTGCRYTWGCMPYSLMRSTVRLEMSLPLKVWTLVITDTFQCPTVHIEPKKGLSAVWKWSLLYVTTRQAPIYEWGVSLELSLPL